MKRRGWNPTIVVGMVLGACLGGIVALILVRRYRQRAGFGLREVPWRELMQVSGPFLALGRWLLEISRREISELDMS